MNHNTFGPESVPPAHPMSSYSPPPDLPPADDGHRGRGGLVAAGIAGAVVASITAALITLQSRDATGGAAGVASTPATTVTVAAPTPQSPAPLPTGQANRNTCLQGWVPASNLMASAVAAVDTLPPGMQIRDPMVQTNPQWGAALQTAGDFYREASDVLEVHIAPGTAPLLYEASVTAVKALRVLADATARPSEISGNASNIANEAATQVDVLCTLLP